MNQSKKQTGNLKKEETGTVKVLHSGNP